MLLNRYYNQFRRLLLNTVGYITSYTLQPTDVNMYNPMYHIDIDLYYIKMSDDDLTINKGFELNKEIKSVSLSDPLEEIIVSTLSVIAFNSLTRKRILIVFDDDMAVDKNRSSFLVSLFKGLSFLRSEIITKTFDTKNEQIRMCDVPLALCLIKFLDLTYCLKQSDPYGTFRNIEEPVLDVTGLTKFLNSSFSQQQYLELLHCVYVKNNFYVLFGKEGIQLYDMLSSYSDENKGNECNLDFKEIVKTLFRVGEHSDKNSLLIFSDLVKYVQVTDNRKLIEYLHRGKVDIKNKVFTSNKFEIIVDDVIETSSRSDDNSIYFLQWRNQPVKEVNERREYVFTLLKQRIDVTKKRFNMLLIRMKNLYVPDIGYIGSTDGGFNAMATNMINYTKSFVSNLIFPTEGNTLDFVQQLDHKMCNKCERLFTRRMFFDMDKPQNLKEELVALLEEPDCITKYIYSLLINANIFPQFPRYEGFARNDDLLPTCKFPSNFPVTECRGENLQATNEELLKLDINIDLYALHFVKKFLYFRYEGFYLLTCLQFYNYKKYKDIARSELKKSSEDFENEKIWRVPFRRLTYFAKIKGFFSDHSETFFDGEPHKDRVSQFSSDVVNGWIDFTGPNYQLVKQFKDRKTEEEYSEMTATGEESY